MKRVIPVLIAAALIIIIMAAGPGKELMEGFRYSFDDADLEEYFDLESPDEGAIIFGNDRLEEKALVREGEFYLPLALVKDRINTDFYLDTTEGLLLYTVPDKTYAADIGASSYYIYGSDGSSTNAGHTICFMEGETPYISLDYVKSFTNFGSVTYTSPYRIQLTTDYSPRDVAQIKKDTHIRYQGGVKSDILCPVEKDTRVEILEEMETWTKVKYEGFMGYVENKRLTDKETYIPVPEQNYTEPVFTHIAMEEKVCLGWHQVGSAEAAVATLDEVTKNAECLNVISPTFFSLSDNEGGFKSIASSRYVSDAHRKGLQVWGLVDNFSTEISSYEILSSTSRRTRLIKGLVDAAKSCEMDGINIDFEQLSSETGEHFAQFIRELSVVCRREHLVLSVDNYVPQGGTDFYRRDVQGKYADYVVIMGYDEHWAGCPEAGSVASIDYVEMGILMTLDQVPAERIINGVPFYTRVWTTDASGLSDQALGMSDAESFLARNGVKAVWDDTTCQNYAQFQSADKLHQVWMEDEDSIATKLSVMTNHNLAGVAAWKLGFEKPSIWNVIDGYLHG